MVPTAETQLVVKRKAETCDNSTFFAELRRLGAEKAFAQVRSDPDALQRSVKFLLKASMPNRGAFKNFIKYAAYLQLITDINTLCSDLH